MKSTATWQLLGYRVGGDAVALAGSERNALRVLRRQLKRQRQSIAESDTSNDKREDAQVKRTQRAIDTLSKGHSLTRDEYETGFNEKTTHVRYIVNHKNSIEILRTALRRPWTLYNRHETLSPEEVEELQQRGFIFIFR